VTLLIAGKKKEQKPTLTRVSKIKTIGGVPRSAPLGNKIRDSLWGRKIFTERLGRSLQGVGVHVNPSTRGNCKLTFEEPSSESFKPNIFRRQKKGSTTLESTRKGAGLKAGDTTRTRKMFLLRVEEECWRTIPRG